jgi:ribose transport system substrate-binding protein
MTTTIFPPRQLTKFIHFVVGVSLCIMESSVTMGAPIRIGVLAGDQFSIFHQKVTQGAQAAGKAAGVEIISKVSPVPFSAFYQIKLLSAFGEDLPDALVIGPVAVDQQCIEELRAPIGALAAKGVKIVVFGVYPMKGFANTSVMLDEPAMARAGVDRFISILAETDEVVVVRSQSNEGVNSREKLAIKELRERFPRMVIHSDIFIDKSDADGLAQAKLVLMKHPTATAVFTSISQSTNMMVAALRESKNPSAIKFVGFGSQVDEEVAAAIKRGILTAFIAQQPFDLGYKAVEIAVAAISGHQQAGVVRSDFVIVSKENLAEVVAHDIARK